MYSEGKTHLFSLKVKTDGLYGEAFTFGVSVWDLQKKEIVSSLGGFAELEEIESDWCKEHEIPLLQGKHRDQFVKFPNRHEMRTIFWNYYSQWRQSAIILADYQYPCETGFFRQCVMEDLRIREWFGPYPIVDLGTMLAMLDRDPNLDRVKLSGYNGLDKHNAIHASMIAAKIYFMLTNEMEGLFETYRIN